MSKNVNNSVRKELARRELARRRLIHFTKFTHGSYEPGWVHHDICERLERFSKAVEDRKSPRLMLLMPPRHGKQLDHNTLVPTPDGFKKHGDLKVGDLVYRPDGTTVAVTALSQETYQDVEVEFMDGTAVKCHENHEWTLFDRSSGSFRTVDTKYLESQTLLSGAKPRARFQLPLYNAVEGTHTPLEIDPYFLGAWLGDGKSSEPVICGAESDLEHIIAAIPYDRGSRTVHKGTGVHYQTFVGGIRGLLRIAGLLNNKHIPEEYLLSSVEQRLSLLAGLVDTDGSVEAETQRVRFRSGSKRLADDVTRLVRSLGYRASVDYTPPDTRERDITGGESWCVQWTPHDARGGGTLERKRVTRVRRRRRVGLKAVRRVERSLGRCVQVDAADGLYLVAETYVATHNSELASIRFPAWHLGHYPNHEIINVGYNTELPTKFSRKVREVALDPLYKNIFPDMRLDQSSKAVEAWNTTRGGGFTAAGVGGGITGKGAHVLIVDDPIKNQEESDSALIRDKLWDWFQSTAYTRLAPGGGVLVIETWWNDDDLAGRLQVAMGKDPDADQYEIVKYPALSEYWEYRDEKTREILRFPEEPPSELLPAEHTFLRPKDFCLHEARFPMDALHRIKSNLQPRIWSALYQQNPVPDEGMFFQADWFRHQRRMPSTDGMQVYTAWDFAISEKQVNDWTVGATVMQDEFDTLYVLDVFRFKGDSFQIVDAIIDVAERYGSDPGTPYLVGFEDGQIFRAIKPMLEKRMEERRMYPPYEVLKPLTDKAARARPLQGRLQQGKVVFPEEAHWLAQAKKEMLRFPAGAHDDVVDALAWVVQLCLGKPPPKIWEPPPPPSWKDRLDHIGEFGGTHMSA